MTSPIIRHPDQVRLQWQGWMCSVLIHTIMGAGALALLSSIQIQLPPDQFTWNVAMVETPKPQSKTETQPEAKPQSKPTPPKTQAVESPPQPAQRVVQTVRQRVVQPVQTAHPVVQRQVTQVVQAPSQVSTVNQTASVVTQAVQHSETSQTVTPTEIHETVVQEEQVVPTQAPVIQDVPAPVVAEAPVEQPPVAPVFERAVVETVNEPVTQTQEIVRRPVEPLIEQTPIEPTAEPVTQSQQVVSRPAEPLVERASVEPTVAPTSDAAAQPAVEQAIARAEPRTVPATRADYGWLVKALLGRVDQLKRYPHLARLNQWEGKVVLRAVIKDDGQVLKIDVHESSGRSILDNDAVETLRKASPLKLDHPLGKPQVAVLMPISYTIR